MHAMQKINLEDRGARSIC